MNTYTLYVRPVQLVLETNQEFKDRHQYLKEHINQHNRNSYDNGQYPDAGFDIPCPQLIIKQVRNGDVLKVSFGIQCEMVCTTDSKNPFPTSYYLYPRSSIYKRNIRLANSVGIIDSGYRGEIKAIFDAINDHSVEIKKYERIAQLCAPDLGTINNVMIVDTFEDTSRGSGGFGSTGE